MRICDELFKVLTHQGKMSICRPHVQRTLHSNAAKPSQPEPVFDILDLVIVRPGVHPSVRPGTFINRMAIFFTKAFVLEYSPDDTSIVTTMIWTEVVATIGPDSRLSHHKQIVSHRIPG